MKYLKKKLSQASGQVFFKDNVFLYNTTDRINNRESCNMLEIAHWMDCILLARKFDIICSYFSGIHFALTQQEVSVVSPINKL